MYVKYYFIKFVRKKFFARVSVKMTDSGENVRN